MAKNLWTIDPVHSEILFKVRHMMITNVTGTFDRFEAKMNSSESDFSDAEISFEAEVASVNTRNEQRDEHLRSNDFFDAEKFPKISFVSKGFSKIADSKYKMTGDFNLKGITKEIVLDVNFTGVVIDPWGQVKSGFEMETILKRADYGLNWNAQSEDGSVVLSEDVRLQVTAQMIKQV